MSKPQKYFELNLNKYGGTLNFHEIIVTVWAILKLISTKACFKESSWFSISRQDQEFCSHNSCIWSGFGIFDFAADRIRAR